MAILRENWIVLAIAVAFLAGFAFLIWLWWWIPKWQIRAVTAADPKARAEIEDNFRKTVGQALGGAAVLIGAVFGAGWAYLQFSQQQQAIRDQLQATRDLLISNQVSKGFEQLGSKEIVVRLGGIYALEGAMKASPEYYQPVLEALCAFVRESTKGDIQDDPATDVQAALTVIGRRKPGPGSVLLVRADISRAYLTGAYLTDALLGGADLRGAYLIGANLRGSDLRGATLNDADLDAANLTSADLSGTHLIGADLTFADLEGAILHGADLHEAVLVGANLRASTILPSGESLGWINATLSDSNLSSANLNGANLSGLDLDHADLRGADLTGADLSNVRNLVQEQLEQACGKPKVLPTGLTPEKPCPRRPVAPFINRKTAP